jgi:cytoskeletal protein CcmA (bactofilin family)
VDETAGDQARNRIDAGASCEGEFRFDGATLIAGQVEGEITANHDLLIAETAEVNADISAASIVVAGHVRGSLRASERIELRPTAKICGDLASPALVVHEGAQLEGDCSVAPAALREETESQVEQAEPAAAAAVSFFITARQKAELRARGYDDAAISKMNPAEAHKILGVT